MVMVASKISVTVAWTPFDNLLTAKQRHKFQKSGRFLMNYRVGYITRQAS